LNPGKESLLKGQHRRNQGQWGSHSNWIKQILNTLFDLTPIRRKPEKEEKGGKIGNRKIKINFHQLKKHNNPKG